ncbi:MAG: hypothetical protein K1X77_02670 [Bacteroidia bacterium]|nr:hypothetical protein [Bacteroidia bacterium]
MDKRKHIALITTWYPPAQGVAVQRMLAFLRYFDQTQFRFSVLTILLDNTQEFEQIDSSSVYRLENKPALPVWASKREDKRHIHLLKTVWNYTIQQMQPYTFAGWQKLVQQKLEQINTNDPIQFVLSSSSPVEAHLAAAAFAKTRPEICWVADMRDELAANPHITERLRKVLTKAEQTVNLRANIVTSVSTPILDDFKNRMPGVVQFAEIRNGFDHTILPSGNFNKIFTIAFSGTFYGDIKPHTFFKGLQLFLSTQNIQYKLMFVGTYRNFEIPGELLPHCIFMPQVSYEDAVNYMAQADANLLILPPSGRKGVYSGKLFDYLSVKKPIIALLDPNDVAAELIGQCNAGFVAQFNNHAQIANSIQQAHEVWEKQLTLPYNHERIESLHRKFQVEKLNNLLLQWQVK